jgi:hypothetical protein
MKKKTSLGKKIDDEELVTCCICGEEKDISEFYDDTDMCTECAAQCEHCEEVCNIEDLFYVDKEGYVLCENCVAYCCRCNNAINPKGKNTNTYDTDYYCQGCWDELSFCDECDCPVESDDIYHCEDCDAYFCECCFNERHNDHKHSYDGVYDAGYRPYKFTFYPDDAPQTALFHGIEFEIDGADETQIMINKLLLISKGEQLFWLKEDSSLSDEGVELVTSPMTLDAHRKVMPWNKVLSVANRYANEEATNYSCGLHIHSNKQFFVDASMSVKEWNLLQVR